MSKLIIISLVVFMVGCCHYAEDTKTLYGFGEIELDEKGDTVKMKSTLFPLPKVEIEQ